MTLSTVDLAAVKGFIRIDHGADDDLLNGIVAAARAYILAYTGLSATAADALADLPIACLVLCADMYENRTLSVENGAANKVVESILGMHQVNLV